MAQSPAGIPARAMPPVANPYYINNDNADFKQTPTPGHVLARPAPTGVDPRLTVAGDVPRTQGLPSYVPYAGQTPYNVWALYPA
jgi:hypothetical protein